MMSSLFYAAAGAWGSWYFGRQLYTAAMHDYILTGIPEQRYYRANTPKLFRNNVIAAIAIFPLMVAGFGISIFDLFGL